MSKTTAQLIDSINEKVDAMAMENVALLDQNLQLKKMQSDSIAKEAGYLNLIDKYKDLMDEEIGRAHV